MKKNWKKTLAALTAFAAVWTLAACSAGNTPAPASDEDANASNTTRMPADLRDEYGDDFDEDDDEYWYDDDYGYNDDYDDDDQYDGGDDDARTEEYEFNFNGRTVHVDMTLDDGWWVYVTDDFVFLYDPETPSESEGMAYGYPTTAEEFETEWETYRDADDCQRGELGFTATLDGTGIHAFALEDGIYYTIITFKPEQAEDVYERFNVWLED